MIFPIVLLALTAATFPTALRAQTVNGEITGTVADPTGGVIPGASVTLTYPLTGQQREVMTGESGDFLFPDLVPGNYEVSISKTGFEAYSQKGISLASSEILSLHQIQLSVGSQSTEVTVTANEAHVETDSSEHSGLVNSNQMTDITVKGRNYLSYVALLPGVTTTGQADAPGWGSGDGLSFNGGNSAVVTMLNGIVSQDDGGTGSPGGFLAPSADAVQEMKVQTGNVNAEYGTRNGGTINVIYKTGTKDFHGSLYDYERNNFFNANTYFNKRLGSTNPAVADHPPDYKFTNPGGTFGGPFWLPKIPFNKNRDKLFLFFSADLLRRNVPTAVTNLTMPTVDDREGNFAADAAGLPASVASQYGLNGTNNTPTSIAGVDIYCPGTEPTSGSPSGFITPVQAENLTTACPGYAAVASPWAALAGGNNAVMSLFPMPTCNSYTDLYNAGLGGTANPGLTLPVCGTSATGYTNNYNWQGLLVQKEPRSDYILTGQYNLAKNEIWTVDLEKGYQCTCNGNFLGASGWPSQLLTDYLIHSNGLQSNFVSTIRPNLVNEFIAGVNRALQTTIPANPNNPKAPGYEGINVRNSDGLGPSVLPVLFPDPNSPYNQTVGGVTYEAQSKYNNPQDFLPKMSFTSPNLTSPASITEDGRWPFFGTDTHYNLEDDITWVKGTHAFKAGFYWERVSRNGPSGGGGGDWSGNILFGQSATNPNDTGFGFSNVYYGIFSSYDQESDHPLGYDRWHNMEWFVQDTWKATRRLTVDYGIRFGRQTPTYDVVETSDFRPDVYNAADQPPLIQPCMNGGVRVGCYTSGSTTDYFTQSAIGDFVPQSTSGVAPFQGMVAYAPRTPVVNDPPITIGPRFGFAYDVFGNGKTALRGGFGMFYSNFSGVDTTGQLVLQPPPPSYTVALPATNRQELVLTPSVLNSTLPQMLEGGSQTFISPQSVIGLPRNFKTTTTYSWNLGIQHDLGHGLLLDVSYVANINEHNSGSEQLQQLPYGINWLNTNGTYANSTCGNGTLVFHDPTKSACTVLPSVFFDYPVAGYSPSYVNHPGYSGISQMYLNLNSNYNSLQAQVTKRFGRALTLGAAWTYAKELGWTEPDPLAPKSLWHSLYYGTTSTDPKDNLVANWTWNLPHGPFQNAILKQAFNGWVLEGIFTYVTGSPGLVTVGGSYNLNGGGGWGTRVNLVSGTSVYDKTGVQYLNLAAFAPPTGGQGTCEGTAATCGFGNSGLHNYVGPATNNWDASLFKDFQWSKNESRKLEVRWETYNTLNHTQFTTLNSTATLNAAPNGSFVGSANPTFGQFSATNPQRIMALAAKLMF